jgi:Asp-tRNA(Asn)/Glu-tRNA(Gln) amidotransferase B subunit
MVILHESWWVFMSKNERILRTFVAGAVFLGIGLFATMNSEEGFSSPKKMRGPAAVPCEICASLSESKTELLELPTPESQKKRSKKVRIEVREARILRGAGKDIGKLLKVRQPTEEEFQAIARFLVGTVGRDGAGIALDVIAETVSPEQMGESLTAIDSQITTLVSQGEITANSAKLYRATVDAFRSQGE